MTAQARSADYAETEEQFVSGDVFGCRGRVPGHKQFA